MSGPIGAHILALDIATTMGWCEGVAGERPFYGVQKLGGEEAERDAMGGALIEFLVSRFVVSRPRLLVIEAPIAAGAGGKAGKTSSASAMVLLSLDAVAGAVAARMGVSHRRFAVSSIRKHFIGNGGLSGSVAKPRVFQRCKQLGYEPQDFNASDAIALWDYACALTDPKAHSKHFALRGA